MAIKQIGRDWCPGDKNYSEQFVLDTEDDVKALPMCCAGSTALVCSTGNVYIVNASGQWVKFAWEA